MLRERDQGANERREKEAVDRGLRLLMQELEALSQFVRERNKRFAVLMIVTQEEDATFHELHRQYGATLAAFCKEKNIPVIDVTPILIRQSNQRPIFRFPKDPHWTAPAHDIAGKELATFMRSNRLIEWVGSNRE